MNYKLKLRDKCIFYDIRSTYSTFEWFTRLDSYALEAASELSEYEFIIKSKTINSKLIKAMYAI